MHVSRAPEKDKNLVSVERDWVEEDLQKGWIYFYYTHRFPQPLCSSKKYGSPSWQLLLAVCKLRGRQVEQPMPAILALRKQEAGPKFEVSLDYKKRSFLKNK